MSHIRQQIREAVATVLDGLPLTGASVFKSRVHPIAAGRLPCILVYTTDEESALYTSDDDLERQVSLTLEIVADGPEFDDLLDTIAVDVEVMMAANPTLGGLAFRHVLTSSRATMTGEGEKRTGLLRLTYAVTCHTALNDPTAAL